MLPLDNELIAALHAGDEATFETLVGTYYASMLRITLFYVNDHRLAEDVIQDTWIAVLRGLGKFRGQASFKTWVYSILINKSKTAARRESRYNQAVPFEDDTAAQTTSVPPERFNPPDHPQMPGHWAQLPQSWDNTPEEHLLSQETLVQVERAINALPPNQREVIILRDVEHCPPEEVCNILGITDSNQRVLLHRARSKVRAALERYFDQ